MDWSKARRPRGWSYDASPYRPATVMDIVLAEPPRRPVTPAPAVGPAGGITLAYLTERGVNRLAIWCADCKRAEHRPIDALAADMRALPISDLGGAVRCDACGGQTMVSPFTESPVRNARSHL
jgi:hypothetical protein